MGSSEPVVNLLNILANLEPWIIKTFSLELHPGVCGYEIVRKREEGGILVPKIRFLLRSIIKRCNFNLCNVLRVQYNKSEGIQTYPEDSGRGIVIICLNISKIET